MNRIGAVNRCVLVSKWSGKRETCCAKLSSSASTFDRHLKLVILSFVGDAKVRENIVVNRCSLVRHEFVQLKNVQCHRVVWFHLLAIASPVQVQQDKVTRHLVGYEL